MALWLLQVKNPAKLAEACRKPSYRDLPAFYEWSSTRGAVVECEDRRVARAMMRDLPGKDREWWWGMKRYTTCEQIHQTDGRRFILLNVPAG